MKKLLIVDDDDGLRGLYRRRLSDVYQIFDTGDPEQALALALEHKPDAMVLDLKMPKFDGFDLVRNFRSLSYTAQLPIFVVTGQSGKHKSECESLGATGYFEKPIDFVKLKQTLAATLANKSSQQNHAGAALRMKVRIRLQGTDTAGQEIAEVAETETVSPEGFECVSSKSFREGTIFKVFLMGCTEHYAGDAKLRDCASAGLERQRYRFEFAGETNNWILQKKR
jgi:DNA-binding response OmpR family regulator